MILFYINFTNAIDSYMYVRNYIIVPKNKLD